MDCGLRYDRPRRPNLRRTPLRLVPNHHTTPVRLAISGERRMGWTMHESKHLSRDPAPDRTTHAGRQGAEQESTILSGIY